jgi:hypothetical protein
MVRSPYLIPSLFSSLDALKKVKELWIFDSVSGTIKVEVEHSLCLSASRRSKDRYLYTEMLSVAAQPILQRHVHIA